MFTRFYRTFRIFGPLYINVSKRGISFSIRKRGISITKNKHHTRLHLGVPGTGFSVGKTIKQQNTNNTKGVEDVKQKKY